VDRGSQVQLEGSRLVIFLPRMWAQTQRRRLDSEVVVSDAICNAYTCMSRNVVVLTIYLQYSHRFQGRIV
jgi:hypothetical protein